MQKENRCLRFFKKHVFFAQALLSYGVGLIGVLILCFTSAQNSGNSLLAVLMLSFFYAIFFIYPFVIAGYHAILLYTALKSKHPVRQSMVYDYWTLFLAFFYELLYLGIIKEVSFSADWTKPLYNGQRHTPIATGSYASVVFLLVVFLLAFSVLRISSVNRLPPLVTVLCISVLYLGLIFVVVWTVQIFKMETILDVFLLLPSFVLIFIAARIIALKIKEFEPDQARMSKIDGVPILHKLNEFLMDAKTWPYMAFLLTLPLLAIFLVILVLFGQAPNSFIKAFTETSEWNLSQKISPQNLYYDEHYLCTVAAGGHRRLVRPLRKGVRHGNMVVVNRQLLIANAFEQILEEKIPVIHKVIRGIYDRYGFPLARLIKSKWMADAIWLAMKPLEWGFLMTIYLCDRYPEDRIAIQYTGKNLKEFSLSQNG